MSTERNRAAPRADGPEVVLDVDLRSGAFVLVLSNTGSSTAFEPRVKFSTRLGGLGGAIVVSDLPIWSGLAMLRPGSQIDVLLDAQSAQRSPEDRRFTVTVTYREASGRSVERSFSHDLDTYVGLPSLLA